MQVCLMLRGTDKRRESGSEGGREEEAVVKLMRAVIES